MSLPSVIPEALAIVLWIPACVLLAELLCALIHWWEDRYANPAWPLIGPWIAAPNQRHHREQRAFLANGWWRANEVQIVAALAVVSAAALAGFWSWQLGLVTLLAANANTVHQWATAAATRTAASSAPSRTGASCKTAPTTAATTAAAATPTTRP
jgi:ubiquitin-conjugating enzyme E2 variant